MLTNHDHPACIRLLHVRVQAKNGARWAGQPEQKVLLAPAQRGMGTHSWGAGDTLLESSPVSHPWQIPPAVPGKDGEDAGIRQGAFFGSVCLFGAQHSCTQPRSAGFACFQLLTRCACSSEAGGTPGDTSPPGRNTCNSPQENRKIMENEGSTQLLSRSLSIQGNIAEAAVA